MKLAGKMEKILEDANFDLIKGVVDNTKKNIMTGGLRQLSKATLLARERGFSSFSGHSPTPTPETRPLFYTGRLYDSIKATKEGMEIMEYGLDHHEGFTTPSEEIVIPPWTHSLGKNKYVHPRRFIAADQSGKYGDKGALDKEENEIVRKMNRIMKKGKSAK